MKTILLFDTSSVLHSVKFSLAKHKLSHKEKPTFVIYGFLMKLQFMLRKTRPDVVVYATDSEESKRKKLRHSYKERRKKDKSPEDIALDKIAYPQFEEIIDTVLPEIGYKNIFGVKGLEADDIIASICKQYTNFRIIIVSNDGDLYQLLTDDVCMFDPRANRYFTIDDFREKYGVEPNMWKRVKAIGGCKSDEIKGVEIPQPDPTKKVRHIAEKGAINFLLGKTKETTQAYKAITSKEGIKQINKNKALVILPFRGTPKFRIKKDRLSKKMFMKLCKGYGFKSIKEDMKSWSNILRLM